MSISVRLEEVQRKIHAAATRVGRDPQGIRLVAVTKTHPPDIVREALQAGVIHLGENKVQEALAKVEQIGTRGTWHLIGHLQSNKAKVAARIFDWIHSVDSMDIAQELSRRAADAGKTLSILMEVNVSGEASKFGIAPDKALGLAESINQLPRLELKGLMTLAPFFEEPEKARPFFIRLRELRDEISATTGFHLPELSMGMSHDFEVAIEEGSTCVRIGTALFGGRPAARTAMKAE